MPRFHISSTCQFILCFLSSYFLLRVTRSQIILFFPLHSTDSSSIKRLSIPYIHRSPTPQRRIFSLILSLISSLFLLLLKQITAVHCWNFSDGNNTAIICVFKPASSSAKVNQLPGPIPGKSYFSSLHQHGKTFVTHLIMSCYSYIASLSSLHYYLQLPCVSTRTHYSGGSHLGNNNELGKQAGIYCYLFCPVNPTFFQARNNCKSKWSV